MIDTFKLGYANRTLAYRLPEKSRQAGAAIRGRLQALGMLRESGHEHFNGSLVAPVLDENGDVVQLYGRKVTPEAQLRKGTPLPLYLPGPLRGFWNIQALSASREIILCEALLDAFTFWVHGFRNVTAAYGVNGFTEDHWEAFRKYGVERVYIAYDRDEAGDRAGRRPFRAAAGGGDRMLPGPVSQGHGRQRVRPEDVAAFQSAWLAAVFDSQTGVRSRETGEKPKKTGVGSPETGENRDRPSISASPLPSPVFADPLRIRDRAILEVFYSTGVRRFELISLKLYDVDAERGTLMVREGKGKKDRMVPIGERAAAWVAKYLEDGRQSLAVEPDDGTLFLTVEGTPFTPNRLTQLVRGYVNASGVGKKGACHLFRHTMATLMLEGGADIRFIQQMLGHAKLETTQIYTQVSIRKLKEIHTATHPGARLRRTPRPPGSPRPPDAEPEDPHPVPRPWPGAGGLPTPDPGSRATPEDQLLSFLAAESAEEDFSPDN